MTNKQKRNGIILIVLLVLLIGVYGLVQLLVSQKEKKQEEEANAALSTVVDANVSKITEFSYQVDDTTYTYQKDGEEWICTNDASIDLDESQVETLLSNLSGVTTDTAFTDYESLEDYGLTEPENTITFTEDGTKTTLYLGEYNGMLQKYYLKAEGKEEVYMLDGTLWSAFSVTPDSMEQEVEETESTESTESTEMEGTE